MFSIRNAAAIGSATAALMVVAGVVVTAPASAKSTDVIKTGTCSAGHTFKLKAKPDNGALEVDVHETPTNVPAEALEVELADEAGESRYDQAYHWLKRGSISAWGLR